MVDGVAGRAPDTEHLSGWMLQRSEGRQVLVAVAVDLVGAHDDVPAAPGEGLENPAEWHPALDGTRGTDRRRVGQ